VCVCMHVYLWTLYSCSLSRSVQASQEDVRTQDGEEIFACVEDSLPTDSLALLCKMLPEKAETFVFNRLDYCAQVNFDLRSFCFLSDFSCNLQPFDLFLRRLSSVTPVFVFAFASASLINFGLEWTLNFFFLQLYSKQDDFHCIHYTLSASSQVQTEGNGSKV